MPNPAPSSKDRSLWPLLALAALVLVVFEAFRSVTAADAPRSFLNLAFEIIAAGIITAALYLVLRLFALKQRRHLDEARGTMKQQEIILELGGKLATVFDEEKICWSIIEGLKGPLGFDLCGVSIHLKPAMGGSPQRYGDKPFSEAMGDHAPIPRVNAPLRLGSTTFGNLSVENPRGEAFKPREIAIIYACANQAAIALSNAHLFAEQRKQQSEAEQRHSELYTRERYLSLLNAITQEGLRAQELQPMLQTMTEHLGQLFEANSCILALWDDSLRMVIPTTVSGAQRGNFAPAPIEGGELAAVAIVLDTGSSLVIEDALDSPYISPRLATRLQSRSALALPLISSEQKLGVALICFQGKREITPVEISYGEQAASQIALAVSKARALDIAQHRAQELDALQRATTALLTTLNLESLLGQILDAAMSAIPTAEKGALYLVVPETGQLQLRATQGFADSRIRSFIPTSSMSYTARAVRERKPLLLNNDVNPEIVSRLDGDFPETSAIASMIVAPLLLGDQTLGGITLGSFRRYAFTQGNLQLLVSFAATATTAIHNAQLHGEVLKQAVTDTLTGLYNRRGLFELGQREVNRAHRFVRPLSSILLDIDHFKQINDTHGHLVGDQILAGVSAQCHAELRQVDLLGRYGGDEFLALLPETELANAVLVAERLRKKVSDLSFPAEEKLIRVSISVGVAFLKERDTLDTLIEHTDQALYKAKQEGKNRIAF